PGTYKWVDTLIESPATRAAIRITDGISPPISSDAGSITVTWDIDTNDTEFTLTLSDYSDTAAGQYFDPIIGTLHWNDAGTWDDVSWTTDKNGPFYIGHGYSEVWLNADNVLTDGTLRYALAQLEILDEDGVIVFNADHVDSDFYDSISGDYLDADIVLGSVLQIVDGLNISIFGLDNGKASYITGEDGEQVMIVGTGGATSEAVNLKHLDFRGNDDYVLVNNENLSLSDVSVAGISLTEKWTTGTINNTNGTIAVYDNSYLKLDGSADGTAFTYNPGSTLQYMLTPGAASSALTIDDNSAEFGTSIQGLTVDTGVALTLSDRTGAYDVNGNTAVSGDLTINDNVTLSLGGASNELGDNTSFYAGNYSTVNYNRAGAQTVDSVDYYNLTISSSGAKTASDSFDIYGDLTVGSGVELAFDFVAAETVRIAGDTAVDGTLTFRGAGAGTLGLYGTNNDLGIFNYHTSTVSYLGATGQELSDVDYYNLIVGGGTVGTAVVKETVDFDFNVYNDMTIAAYTTFGLDANIVLVEGDFTMSTLGAFVFADDGFLKLKGETNAAFNFDDGFGTVIYQGGDSQLVAGGVYNNLQIANGIKSLGADVTVINDFVFAGGAGIFQLGTYDLYLDGSITGASETSYFASNIASTATDQGKVFLRLAVDEVQNLVIGTASNWSELTFTGGNMQQYVSVWTYDGVTTNGQPGGTEIAHPENAVNMTFNVAPQSAGSYSMDFVDASASAKGADFNPSLVATYYYSGTSGSWTQAGNPLTQSGPFFFGTGVPYGGLVVTNTNNAGSGSLRWAVAAANILDEVNLITFSKDVFYTQETITLTSGEMAITDHVVIQGLGATLTTVSGTDSSRIFNINSGISVSVSGLTLTGGYSAGDGGAIYLEGSLQLENVEIKDSSSAGLGEAIYIADTGALYTMRTTVSSAEATDAGIYSLGTISMFNSTVVNLGDNEAIYLGDTGTGLLFNVTVSTANAGTAIDNDVDASLTLNNTLVYGSVSGTYEGSNNLETTDGTIFAGDTPTLTDNGGWVKTIAIANDVRVVDQGVGYSDGAYRYDARGYLVNGSNDIGAYEYDGYMTWNANTSAYYSSLDSALGAASSADTIELISSRILLDSEITVSSDVTIRGAGAWDTVLSAGIKGAGSDRLFTIGDTNSAPAVHMLDLAIRGGNVSGDGGAVYNYGSLHLHNVMIADNAASGNGGAIYNSADAFVYGERSSIRMNTAENGAGIYNLGSLTLNHSRLANNTASVSGGGIYNGVYGEQKGQLFLLNSTVDHNTASGGDGGGIYSTGTFQAEYSTIYGNSAADDGGGIYNIGDSRLINLTIAGNYAADDGGGIYAATGAVNLVNSIIAYNTDVSGWDDISDTGSVITQLSNFVGTDNSGLYTASNSLFSSSLADNGGWTYTLALNSESGYYYRVVGQGVEVGINYDQRGYMINSTRDLGAYEANGYIGYYLLSDNYRSYFSSIATALTYQSDKATRTLYLLDTRIKEADINADLRYYNSADKKYLPQTVTIKGAASGETVISAGGTGRIF
ncbi:MAG: hypothetical protein KAS17_05760, partial [Victivallaceae bacterium]|nr:hypothetical protein [Victivallaceae bacterium]